MSSASVPSEQSLTPKPRFGQSKAEVLGFRCHCASLHFLSLLLSREATKPALATDVFFTAASAQAKQLQAARLIDARASSPVSSWTRQNNASTKDIPRPAERCVQLLLVVSDRAPAGQETSRHATRRQNVKQPIPM